MDEKFYRRFESFRRSLAALEEVRERDLTDSFILSGAGAKFNITFDLAFVDGDKRKYIEYYEMVLEKLSPGGYIIADNTLWDGHVLEEPHHTDLQTIGIKKFNDLVAADKRVEKVILPLRDGLTIIRKC